MDGQIRYGRTKNVRNSKSKEKTDADNAVHQTGQDDTYAQQKWQNAEIVTKEAINEKMCRSTKRVQ